MRFLAIMTTVAIVVGESIAQPMPETRGEGTSLSTTPAPLAAGIRSSGRSSQSWSSMVAYGSFQLEGEDRFGPMIVIQYTPRRSKGPAVDLYAGVLFQANTTGEIKEDDYIPLASMLAPYYSPSSSHRNENLFRMPHFSIGLAFLGADVTFYLADGPVRPYLGLGGSIAFWSYATQLNGAFAPGMKAGLHASISDSFSGFAEVRRMVGTPSFIGPGSPGFNGLTSAAMGVSFAPRLK